MGDSHRRDPHLGKRDRGGRTRRAETFWGWLRITARLWGFFAFILLVLVLFRHIVLPFIIAAVVTYVLAPILRRLSAVRVAGRRAPRVVWLMALYAALLGLTAVFVTSFVPRLSRDVQRVVREAPQLAQKAKSTWLPSIAQWVERNLASTAPPETVASRPTESPSLRVRQLPDGGFEVDPRDMAVEVVRQDDGRWLLRVAAEEVEADRPARVEDAIEKYFRDLLRESESQAGQLLKLGQRFVVGVMSVITTFILVLMISAFLLVDTERILSWMRNLVPMEFHGDFDNVVQLIDRALGGAIRGQLLICVVNGVLTGIGLTVIGVKYALLLALLAGVMSLIPIFGSIMSTIPIVLVALVSGETGIDVVAGFAVLVWIIGIHLLEANLLNPKIIGTAARIHPVLVIFAVVAGQRTYGAAGALLAVPIFSAIQAMFVYIRAKVRGELDLPGLKPPTPRR